MNSNSSKARDFLEKIEKIQADIDSIKDIASPGEPASVSREALEEMSIMLEEMEVAEEEILKQNEELSQTRDALEAERQRYQDLFEFAPDVYLVTNLKGIILKANRAASELFNVPDFSLQGKPLSLYINPSDLKNFRMRMLNLEESEPEIPERTWEWKLQVKPCKKAALPVSVRMTAILHGYDQPGEKSQDPWLRWLFRDISSQVEKQATLERRSAQIQLLQELAFAANQAIDMQEALQYAVDRLCEFGGWPVGHAFLRQDQPRTELVATDIWHLEEPEKYAQFRQITEKLRLAPGEGLSGRVLESGQALWIEDVTQEPGFKRLSIPEDRNVRTGLFFPILVGKQVRGVLEFFLEQVSQSKEDLLEIMEHVGVLLGRVLERHQARQALLESELRFRTIFQQTYMGIDLVDIEGNIVESNPALHKMLGYSAEEMRQMNFADFTHPDDVSDSRFFFKKLIEGDKDHFQFDKRYICKDGQTVWAHLSVSVFRDEQNNPRYAIALIEDISVQKQLENEIAEVERRLLTRGEEERILLAQELHDGPLQDLHAIAFHLAPIKDSIEQTEIVTELGGIQSALSQVIQSLRATCGELRPPALAPFGLEKAIRSHAGNLQEQYSSLKVVLDLDSDRKSIPEWVRLALFRIYQQAVLNVVRHAQAENLLIRFNMDTDEMVLEIIDDGQGFELPERAVDLLREGHFGLVGAAERANAIGGNMSVSSKPGEGTRVRIKVPRDRDFNDESQERLSILFMEEPGPAAQS